VSVKQYLRRVQVAVGNAAGEGLDFADFRCTFYIKRGDYQNPNSCDLRVYNLSDATANRIHDEFTQVQIQAGYEGNFGLIFRGSIKQVRKGRVNQKESYVDVTAADGDEAYNFSTCAFSIAAGTPPEGTIQSLIKTMVNNGITAGYVPPVSQNGTTRGRTFFGMTRDELRDFAWSQNCAWSIQDGRLTLVPLTSFIPGDVPIISAATGMVGVPEQTQGGILIRTLLNPSIKIGQLIKLDNASAINLYRYSSNIEAQAQNALLSRSIKTNADGLYYVMVVNYTGDTRGTEWYSDLVCLAADATIPPGFVPQAAIAPASGAIRRY